MASFFQCKGCSPKTRYALEVRRAARQTCLVDPRTVTVPLNGSTNGSRSVQGSTVQGVMSSYANEIRAIKQTQNVILEVLKDQFNISDFEMSSYRANTSVKNFFPQPAGRPKKNSVWDTEKGVWTSNSIQAVKLPKVVESKTYFVNGIKMYKRPVGASKRGMEWDYYKGTYVQFGYATTKEEAEAMEDEDSESSEDEESNEEDSAESENKENNELTLF